VRQKSPFLATFNYAFQKGAWTFKSVVSHSLDSDLPQTDAPQPWLAATLGIPMEGFAPVSSVEGLAFNAGWRKAFLP